MLNKIKTALAAAFPVGAGAALAAYLTTQDWRATVAAGLAPFFPVAGGYLAPETMASIRTYLASKGIKIKEQ